MRPLVITGPTATGKTAVSLSIAQRYGATIVSMDAMQVYRGMDIGTAKIDREAREKIPHRCIDIRNPDESFSAPDFSAEAESAISGGGPVILCGGTPFYLRAFLLRLVESPPIVPEIRRAFEALANPHTELVNVDPVLASRLHPNDHIRIVRGLEYFATTGARLSEKHDADPKVRRDCEVVWMDNTDVYDRINQRVLDMMAAGYLDEVRALLSLGYSRELKPMLSLGYKYLANHLLDGSDLSEAVRLTQRDSRHLAKRQRTFLKGLGYFPGGDPWAAADRAFGRAPATIPG